MTSLGSLSDDLLLDIVDQLDTARDVAHLATVSRRTHHLVQHDGWKSFIKSRFPSLYRPADEVPSRSWTDTANRLTYLDRCWEKRGLALTSFNEKRAKGGQRRQPRGQSVQSHSVLDARVLSESHDELLVCGAGENLLVRKRSANGGHPDTWGQVNGHDLGYYAGNGDVTAITTVERLAHPEILVGRANGDLHVLSTAPDGTGVPIQALVPVDESQVGRGSSLRKSPGQLAISWLEWQPESRMLASCKSSVVTLYDLAQTEDDNLNPVAFYDVSRDSPGDETSLIRAAKFMGTDMMACALGGSREPLRWSQIRPTGIELVNAAHNSAPLDRASAQHEVTMGEKTTVRAIEPVGNGNLLLSAWDDGTLRLMDIRTPSAHDAVYRDRFQPYQASSSLLVYGTERFVAGNNTGPDVRFFDLRSPKPYHHTTALACSADSPTPPRSFHRAAPGASPPQAVAACDPRAGRRCTWHAQSRSDTWRPDATIHLGEPAFDRISSLTKASDTAASFYCGVRGAVVEAAWQLSEDVGVARTAPAGWTASGGSGISLMETGVSLCSTEGEVDEFNGVPKLFTQRRPAPGQRGPASRSRLDSAFRLAGT